MAGPVLREIVRDYMAAQFRSNKTTEFTVGEIARGLESSGHSFSNKQVGNALQDLKRLNKSIQTRKVPNSQGGAMYWALVSVLEAATQPEKTEPVKPSSEEAAEVTGNVDVPAFRKPRHDSPEHVEHVVEKHIAALNEALVAQVGQMLSDTEKRVKSAMQSATTPAPRPASAFDWGHLESMLTKVFKAERQEMYNDAVKRTQDQNIMSFADIGAKLSEENTGHMHQMLKIAGDFLTTYEGTTAIMRDMLEKAVGEDDLKDQGFARGFAAGWEAADKRFAKLVKVERESNRNAAAPTDEKPKHDHSLSETLRKLGG